MKVVLMVSHGEYAAGLHDALKMFVGNRDDVVSIGLKQGEDVASLEVRIDALCDSFNEADEFIILADLIGGSPIGAIFYIVSWNLIVTLGMRMLYFKGYEYGGKAVEFLTGEKSTALRESIMMLGSMVIGAVAATWVSINTVFTLVNEETGEAFLDLNTKINEVFPKGLAAIFVILCWYLISKKKMSPL